jgi:hypothetical protein
MDINALSKEIIGAAMQVHRALVLASWKVHTRLVSRTSSLHENYPLSVNVRYLLPMAGR